MNYTQVEFAKNHNFTDKYILLNMEVYPSEKILLYAEVMYERTTHRITLHNYGGTLEWTLAPYNGSYFTTNAKYADSFLIVLQAIHDHTEVHKKAPERSFFVSTTAK